MCTNLPIGIIYGKEDIPTKKKEAGSSARISLTLAESFRPHYTAHPPARQTPPSRSVNVFPRKKRLTRTTFLSLYSSGKQISSPHFRLITSSKYKGYAVIVPKKVAQRSTDRHNIKRRVTGVLQTFHSPLPSSYILYPRMAVKDMRYDEIRAELTALFSSL